MSDFFHRTPCHTLSFPFPKLRPKILIINRIKSQSPHTQPTLAKKLVGICLSQALSLRAPVLPRWRGFMSVVSAGPQGCAEAEDSALVDIFGVIDILEFSLTWLINVLFILPREHANPLCWKEVVLKEGVQVLKVISISIISH
jgi:hypothetical protein